MDSQPKVSRRAAVTALATGLGAAVLPGSLVGTPVKESPVSGNLIPPPAFSGNVEAVSRTELLSYARSLSYDTAIDASDERRLFYDDGRVIHRGPMARISPALGLGFTGFDTLSEGRIVARVTLDDDWEYTPHGKGDTFIWLDGRDPRLRAVLVSTDIQRPLFLAHNVILHSMPHRAGAIGMARFRWHDGPPGYTPTWMRCTEGCCEIHTSPPKKPGG
jgi:hypothetical protein